MADTHPNDCCTRCGAYRNQHVQGVYEHTVTLVCPTSRFTTIPQPRGFAHLTARGEAILQELTARFIDLRSFTGDGTKDERARAAVAAYKMENALNAAEDFVRELCRG